MIKALLTLIFFCAPLFAANLDSLDSKTSANLIKQFPDINKREYTKSELDQVIKWLILHEQFESAYYYYDESFKTYKIKTGLTHRVGLVKLLGVTQLAESDIRAQIGASEKSTFDQEKFLNAAERIRLYYRELGYYSTTIDIEFHKKNDQYTDVFFKVNEGTRTNISNISFQTPNEDLKKILARTVKNHFKQPYNLSTITDIKKEIRTFFSENRYFKAEIEDPQIEISKDEKSANLLFVIKSPEQYSVITDSESDNDVHQNAIKAIGIKNFVSTNPNIPQEIASRVKNHLVSQGYAKAEVKYEEEDSYSFSKKIRLKILEGKKVRIEKIEVSGRLTKEPKFYENFIRKNSSPILEKNYYVKDDLEVGFKNLIIDRQNNGYLKATKISHRATYNKEGDSISIYVNFDEGPLTQIQKITFEGNAFASDAQLLRLLELRQMEPLRLNQLEEALTRIKQFYLDAGFLEMIISNEKEDLVNYNEDNTLAHIKIKIYEGPKVIVGSIVIEGNTITKDHVVLSEIDFSVGEILTPTKIEESITKLQRLGIFSSVSIRTLEEKTMLAKRTVLVSVTDRDPGLINFGFGFTNERTATLRGFGGVAYKNLFGSAHVLSSRIDVNYNTDIKFPEYKFTVGYLWPYLFSSKVKLRTNYTRSIYVSNFDSRTATNIEQGSLTFERDITSHLLVSYDLWIKAKYEDFTINSSLPSNQLEIGSTALSAELDYRDHPFNPRKGYLARLSTEYGSPFFQSTNTITFERSMASMSGYIPLGEKGVWANSLRGGHLVHLNTNTNSYVPYDKKGFILGGQSTIRGFTPAEAFPNSNDLGTALYQLRTHASMVLFKSELRFPIWGDIGGALFYDGGLVTIPSFDLPYRHSAGISARWNTPVGPISLEFGWKLNMKGERNESPTAVHLSVGTF